VSPRAARHTPLANATMPEGRLPRDLLGTAQIGWARWSMSADIDQAERHACRDSGAPFRLCGCGCLATGGYILPCWLEVSHAWVMREIFSSHSHAFAPTLHVQSRIPPSARRLFRLLLRKAH